MSQHEYKLVYFNFMGRGEPIRMIFAFKGIKYEDKRLDLQKEWPSVKPTTPFGSLPVLYIDGKPLAQSTAIARYLGRTFGMAGKNDWEAALCDQYVDGLNDLNAKMTPYFIEQDPEKKKALGKKNMEEDIKPFFERYENFLKASGTGHFVGNSMTWADLALFSTFAFLGKDHPELFGGKTHLQNFMKSVSSIPSIREWLDKRPQTPL